MMASAQAEATAKQRRDRTIIAEALKKEHELALAAESELMQKELGATKQHVLKELEAVKPVALQSWIRKYESALQGKAYGGGASSGGRGQLFGGGGSDDDDEEEEEEDDGDEDAAADEDEENEMRMDPYDGLSPAVGAKRSSGSGSSTALVTPGSYKKKAKRAKAEQREAMRDRLTEALVGENGAATGSGNGGGAEEIGALLGQGEDQALISEALAAVNTNALAAKLKAAQQQAQQEMEREMAERCVRRRWCWCWLLVYHLVLGGFGLTALHSLTHRQLQQGGVQGRHRRHGLHERGDAARVRRAPGGGGGEGPSPAGGGARLEGQGDARPAAPGGGGGGGEGDGEGACGGGGEDQGGQEEGVRCWGGGASRSRKVHV